MISEHFEFSETFLAVNDSKRFFTFMTKFYKSSFQNIFGKFLFYLFQRFPHLSIHLSLLFSYSLLFSCFLKKLFRWLNWFWMTFLHKHINLTAWNIFTFYAFFAFQDVPLESIKIESVFCFENHVLKDVNFNLKRVATLKHGFCSTFILTLKILLKYKHLSSCLRNFFLENSFFINMTNVLRNYICAFRFRGSL